ncbi:hypothetical protein SDC9_20287 [bioreactor metagenome]|jgi:hypothetical protein|uniref:DUF4492 domain-containing protein n=1 Tax=bioreactor metagenome TaxID=1076179 RepID=A0A644U6B9_9ZZZZ|nr:DUF4492 domain-containing protein [Bacteroidales bacterium]MBP8677567.1 DUF4492 domain-containing protein [Bacteroidales bacterium]MBP9583705.1 DUF4492 domain-containing protein [Bacteroidales bacterium]MBP9978306.1 DUF4492 domain-containing protein [Bacteroidales bacterium]WRQ33435.1 DUF4492 domain-containing protein [Bacteroidales bacterium MB20-C3-3]
MRDNIFKRIWNFYYEGFKNMTTLGKTLWIIIAIKLFIMFFVLKLFFFKSDLREYDTIEEKSNKVIENLTNPK